MTGLEHVEIGLYRGRAGRSPEIVAQALRAAADTADRSINSLHAYFVRPADSMAPVLYRVEVTSDAVRRVTAQQHGKAILIMAASFHHVGNPLLSDPSGAVYASHDAHSLDYAVWFHAPFRADERLRYEQERIWTGRDRALCHGWLFDPSGGLVATVAQEVDQEAG